MKRQGSSSIRQSGFTIIEMLITVGVVAITGTIMYNILYTGMILFAKNTAINMANQQARVAVMRMEQDIHASVSVPQMTDTNRIPLTGALASGPAAGISFQLFASGPFQVAATAAAGQSTIQVTTNGVVPVANQRLIIPGYTIESNITSVSGGGTTSTLTLAAPLPQTVQTSLGIVQCFITDRVAYVVQNNQLIYYPRQAIGGNVMLADNITTPTPFSVPATPLGAPYTRFVSAINLSTSDAAYSNLNFKAANMFLNAMEPCRAQLCTYQ